MEKIKNSLRLITYNAIITSLVCYVIIVVFVYSKNPMLMPDTIVGLLTIVPFLVFFVIPLIIIPLIVISIKREYLKNGKQQIKGIYEIILYVLLTVIVVILFDFIYSYLFGDDFSFQFSEALKGALERSNKNFNDDDFRKFSTLPFLLQNMPTFIFGLFLSTIIIYPISISIAKRITSK